MAQQEHDAQKGEEQKPLQPTPANAPENAQISDSESADMTPADSLTTETPAEETPQAETPVGEEDTTIPTESEPATEVTEELAEMTEETPVSISGGVEEDPVILEKAYAIAEAAADHEKTEPSGDSLAAVTGVDDPRAESVNAGLSSSSSPEETPVSIPETTEETNKDTEQAYDLVEATAAPMASGEDDSDDTTASTDDEDDDHDEADDSDDVDYSQLSKEELIVTLQNEVEALSGATVGAGRFKKSDAMIKEIRPVIDQMKRNEWESAHQKYIAETGSEEGFEFKYDESTRQIEELIKDIRSRKKAYFQNLEKSKDQNFNQKTELLQRLRELVDNDESHETGAADMKSSWEEFKKIQEEWKQAGNVSSPHNGTLWATYNALIDRYFSNRNIYFELKELDRKRNAELKADLCEKIENLVATLGDRPMSREVLNEGNQIFEDYKHVGPAPREEQEVLWQRFKKSLDALYDARRAQYEDQKKTMVEVYEKKSKIYEAIVPYTTFSSGSINEWNAKTREIIAYQEEWVNTKGPMPREDGKKLSKKFWSALKTFFGNKGEFFKQLESRREVNLTAKTELCEEVEKIVESGDDTAANTQRIIELQKKWKTIGQVPEKYKDSIYVRFKKSCDAYFEQKRSKNKDQEKGFEENLALKKDLCERIEKAAADPKDSTLTHLNEFKEEWSKIGFVPRKDMQSIQKRYIAAINDYVSAIGKLSKGEKEQVVLESEVELVKEGETNRGLYRKESDIRRKVSQLENDISLWQNNIEFFAKSKTSDKLKAGFEEKIKKASEQLEELKHQLTIIQEAI